MKQRLMLSLAVVVTLCGVTIPIVDTHSQTKPDQLSTAEALTLVRAFSTAEAEKKQTEQGFVSLPKLMQDGTLQRRLQEISVLDAHTATIRDYRLSVVPSADGEHYQLSLAPKSGCGYTLFTNESFVIYEAKALGCSDR